MLFESTAAPVRTSITDIGWFLQTGTPFFFKVGAVEAAFFAGGTMFFPGCGAGRAQKAVGTIPAVEAGVV